MKTRAENPEVFYPGEEPVVATAADIERLKRVARTSPRRRARLCTHQDPADELHEMLIVLPRDAYVRPHRHLDKVESFTVLQGAADLILFHDDGRVRQVIPMGPLDSQMPFYHRTALATYHTLVVRSEFLVFHEVTEGPLRREQTEYADWAPEENDAAAVARFLRPFMADASRVPVLI